MKDLLKLLSIALAGLLGGALPLTLFYLLWSWSVAQIPATLAYAGLVKVGVTVLLLVLGASATVALAILGGVLGAALAVALVDL